MFDLNDLTPEDIEGAKESLEILTKLNQTFTDIKENPEEFSKEELLDFTDTVGAFMVPFVEGMLMFLSVMEVVKDNDTQTN